MIQSAQAGSCHRGVQGWRHVQVQHWEVGTGRVESRVLGPGREDVHVPAVSYQHGCQQVPPDSARVVEEVEQPQVLLLDFVADAVGEVGHPGHQLHQERGLGAEEGTERETEQHGARDDGVRSGVEKCGDVQSDENEGEYHCPVWGQFLYEDWAVETRKGRQAIEDTQRMQSQQGF